MTLPEKRQEDVCLRRTAGHGWLASTERLVWVGGCVCLGGSDVGTMFRRVPSPGDDEGVRVGKRSSNMTMNQGKNSQLHICLQ